MDSEAPTRLVLGLGTAALIAYAGTPMAIVAARRLTFFDRPAGHKVHGAPTPYLGGAAVMLAFAFALLLGAGHPGRTLPLLGGLAVLSVVGTIDDRRNVSPQLRVVCELAAGAVLGALGLGWNLGAGPGVDAAVMAVWVVAVVNAFNLFDNMDGAASTMALVVAAGACVMGLVSGNSWVAVGSAALCGACIGFLPHNLARPAKIFLGDGGSMPLGFAVAALVANAARSAEPSLLSLLTGFLLVGIPALDTTLVIVSRRRRGVSILTGGQDHLTHRTRERVRTARRVALVIGGAQTLLSALVIVATRESSSTLVYVLLAFIVIAGTTIGALEGMSATRAAVRTAAAVAEAPAPPHRGRGQRFGLDVVIRGPLGDRLASVGLFALGLGAGISALFSAYYSNSVWVPIGLVLVILAAAITIARPARFTRRAMLVLAGAAGLGLLSLLSGAWAASVEQATVEANHWLSYVALLLLLLVLLRWRAHAFPLLLGLGTGIGLVAVIVVGRMLGGDAASLFIAGRLNSPLGYINGEGCVFAMACWLGLGLAERREPFSAGLGAAASVVFACLALLSQSRGAALATAAAILVTLVVIPGARRRLFALVFVALGIALAAGPVTHVYSVGAAGPLPASVVHSAVGAILLGAAVAGLGWGVLVALTRRLSAHPRDRALLQRGAMVAAVLVILVPTTAGLLRFSSLQSSLKNQWHAFTHLAEPSRTAASTSDQSRLFSGAGNRYDYWRVAWRVFHDHPVAGVGAGNYAAAYFRQRRTTEAVQNPHSLELQTLSELGLLGGICLALLIAGAVLGIARARAIGAGSPARRTAMVAATGITVVWLVDTSGDWMQLLPGVAAVAFAAIAVLSQSELAGEGPRPLSPRRESRFSVLERSRLIKLAAAAALAFVLAVAGASLLRSALTQFYVDQARNELRHNPAAAITDADRGLRIDGANLDAYYLKAAGLARFNYAEATRKTLLVAAKEDPQSFVTWTLLGDLEVRLRNFSAAKTFYSRAHQLDPGEPGLAALAANPSGQLAQNTQ